MLEPGDVFTVPSRVSSTFPHADPGTRILMFEPAGDAATTGDEHGDIADLRTTHGLPLD